LEVPKASLEVPKMPVEVPQCNLEVPKYTVEVQKMSSAAQRGGPGGFFYLRGSRLRGIIHRAGDSLPAFILLYYIELRKGDVFSRFTGNKYV
jgi:hypothetical protein